jgi:predicted dehydrogenase/threonine dehydrogenase-like Zn-dependent dehydrogenase
MRQILQNLKTGVTELADVPCPRVGPGHLLIRTSRSLVSAGTERMLVDFGKANLLDKARQQPDKVRMVLDKLRTDGVIPTLNAVRNKLDQPLALGYCNAGVVVELGAGVTGFAVGDRVACNGKHAEMVSVPVNLCARIPNAVTDQQAAFTVVGAIALQGIRLVQPTLGEAVVVTGLGLIGQIVVQLLRANGCRVLGIDLDPARLELARSFGAETVNLAAGEDPIVAAERFSRGHGVDAVIVTAATRSSEPMHQAALMCRKRGRIVLVGVTGLELSRDDFFKKELTFQVSCSYGPGRYDPGYEEEGHDYPIGYVRWTEQRNFEAVLDTIADGGLRVDPLISHRFALDDAEGAYQVVGGSEPSLGILLEYPPPVDGSHERLRTPRVVLRPPDGKTFSNASPRVAFIGSGNYATAVLIPAFKSAGATLGAVVSNTGVTAVHAGRKHGFYEALTQSSLAFSDASVDAVVITTRHDSHARLVVQALESGKHVFVEKPLCLTLDELAGIESASAAAAARGKHPLLMAGFNRRFSPHVQKMKALLSAVAAPKSFVMTVNAGAIPPDHWTQDPAAGGGRIIGEACHFVDLLRFLAGSPIVSQERTVMTGSSADTLTMQLRFADGSIGTVHYFANGSKAFPKERLEVFTQGRVLQLDNFKNLKGFGWPGFSRMNLWQQDKGQKACAQAFLDAVRSGGASPIPFDELVEVARTTIALGT